MIMEYQHSTASINLSGIPLLPPLITNDITTEIQYYKQLAIAVEERLKALEIAKGANKEKYNDEPNKEIIEVPKEDNDDLVFKSQSDNVIQNVTLIDAALLDYPTKDKTENLIDISVPTNDTVATENLIDNCYSISEPKQKELEEVNKSVPDETKSCINENLLDDSGGSDTITASTDLHQYLNTSNSVRTDTTDTTPENWKPQVPRTLDIVPITVDQQSQPSDKASSSDTETPKLVRQGSYVLDTPSPLLLAHIQNESTNTDYTPTSDQSAKRKEWNSGQIKTNWVNQSNSRGSITSRSSSSNKNKKNNISNIPSQRNCKSVSNSKAGSPLDVRQSARSVDCIQTMFAKDCYSPKALKSKVNSQNLKYSSPANGTNGTRINISKKTNKSTSMLTSVNKIAGSVGSLNNVAPKPVKKVEKKIDNGTILSKNIDQDVNKSNSSSYSKKSKPVVTSEKIVTVFREIQDTHKKQMIELISRQQKEQVLMQENFKKQQILLLAQIRKAFPEISVSSLSEAICGKHVEQITPLSSKTVKERSDSYENEINKPQINGINSYENNRQAIVSSSMDYTYTSRETSSSCCPTIPSATPTVNSYYQSNSQINQDKCPLMQMSCTQLSNIKIDDIPVGNHVRRHSNVSRQLFPLENRRKKFSVLDDTMYTTRHIKAATIINAYAKGFLVRRLMKTEKVIALKNTYKEALHCMLRLHVDAPLNLPELNFHQRLQLQCDAASMNIVDLFSQSPIKRMEIIAHDREIKKARSDRPSSTRSYSFATQRTLARKKMKELGIYSNFQCSMMSKSCPPRTRCQTWTSSLKERKATTSFINQGIKRSTSAGAVRKPWR